MKKKDEWEQLKEIADDPQFKKDYKEYSDLLQRKLKEFIQDMRELGQTELSTSGPGYELSFKIERKKPQ